MVYLKSMKTSRYNILINNENSFFIYNSFANSLTAIDSETKEYLDGKIEIQIIESSKILELVNAGILINDDFDEFLELKLATQLQRFNESNVTFFIAPTMDCNFNCKYCFENNHEKIFVSKESVVKIVDYLLEFKSRKINIIWYGGEPLMSFKNIESITKELIRNDINFNASIITNGSLLTLNVIDKLKALKIFDIQITLDGLKNTHDSRRPYKLSSSSSFDKIIKNITNLFNANKEILLNLRVNIDKSNENEYIPFLKYIYQQFKGEKIFVAPAFVYETGNFCASGTECFTTNKEKYSFYKNQMQYNNIYLEYFPRLSNGVCTARHKDSYVIDPEGNFYKCPWDIGQKERIITNLDFNYINNELLTNYIVGADHLTDSVCVECNLLPICGGGCVNQRIFNKNQESYCSIFKDFVEFYINLHIEKKQLLTKNIHNELFV